MPFKAICMLFCEEASTQNTYEKLGQEMNFRVYESHREDIYLSAISSMNLRQICVFPIPPIPQRRHDRLGISLLLVRGTKIFPSLSSTSFRPVNNGLGLGYCCTGIFTSPSPVLEGSLLTT